MNSSEDLSDKISESKRKVKFSSRKKKEKDESSSAASSGDEENDDFNENGPNLNSIRTSSTNLNVNSNIYGNIYRKYRKRHVWEVMEGYRDPNMKITQPENYEGILLKRRNWPMKGWHKRYFMLVDGILTYGKSKSDITKNKLHGTVNTFFSIVSYITNSRRILIDFSTQSNAFVCHLKAKTQNDFDAWIEHLKHHRRFYQYKFTQTTNTSHEGTFSRQNSISIQNNSTHQNNSITISNLSSLQKQSDDNIVDIFVDNPPNNNILPNKSDNNSKNKNVLLSDKEIAKQFKTTEESLIGLSKTLSLFCVSKEKTPRNSLSNNNVSNSTNNIPRKKPSHLHENQGYHHHQASSVSFDYLRASHNTSKNLHASKSNPNLLNNEFLATNILNAGLIIDKINNGNSKSNVNNNNITNSSNSVKESSSISNNSKSNIQYLANNNVISLHESIGKQNNENNPLFSVGTPPPLIVLDSNTSNNSIHVSTHENEINNRLNFYQEAKSINEQLNFIYQQLLLKQQLILNAQKEGARDIDNESSIVRSQRSQSVISSLSLQDSQVQFYDAIEYLTSESESDDSDEASDDGSGGANKSMTQAIVPDLNTQISYDSQHIVLNEEELQAQKMLTRRRNLPAPAPDTSQVSVWGILRKAIGKDLSKIALPVILNEPLGILQKLCEELEYSDLLDAANTKQDPYDRMVLVASFIISGYASYYYRNGAKDFNPLLGETYELSRPDKGWKYISEQVSHHPPVSATYCQSKSFIHEQIFHAKIKFWGRSMEVHPEGYSRVTLPKFDETYQWNKIVMYVSNLTGSQRRIEHNGEINIRCTNGVSCTITFPKASYSSQKNEFFGDVIFDNVVKRKVFGQWHETFLCGTDNTAKTIWRMGAMPEDAQSYYGFTRFAIELNEFTENLKEELPPTDSRFRPDQRLFENGKVDDAELEKQKIEEQQRSRRRLIEEKGEVHQPLWFSNDKENSKQNNKDWTFNHQYWSKRESPGFSSKNSKSIFPELWQKRE